MFYNSTKEQNFIRRFQSTVLFVCMKSDRKNEILLYCHIKLSRFYSISEKLIGKLQLIYVFVTLIVQGRKYMGRWSFSLLFNYRSRVWSKRRNSCLHLIDNDCTFLTYMIRTNIQCGKMEFSIPSLYHMISKSFKLEIDNFISTNLWTCNL